MGISNGGLKSSWGLEVVLELREGRRGEGTLFLVCMSMFYYARL